MPLPLIGEILQRDPRRPALWFNGRWYSYADLDERATRLARRLQSLGVGPGDPVTVLALNHLVHFDLFLAAARLGFVYAPLNRRLAPEHLGGLVAQLKPRFAFLDSRHLHHASLFSCGWTRLADYRDWLAAGEARPLPDRSPDPESLWMMMGTGGSTGAPKWVGLPYRQILANARATVAGWGLREDDCAIQATPCFHVSVNVLVPPLLSVGGRIVLMPQYDPGDYLDHLRRHQATQLFLAPNLYQWLIDHREFGHTDFSGVRRAISGGAPLPDPVAERLRERGLSVYPGYGLTEAGVNCFAHAADDTPSVTHCVGRPLPGIEAVVRKPDGAPCPVGEIGELTLAGSQLCAGYPLQPEEWARQFHQGWLWTGDLASTDSEGRFFIHGRRKDSYLSAGETVYPAEIEMALMRCGGVRDCAVISVPDARWGEAGVAVVSVEPGFKLDPPQLREALRAELPDYKLPSRILLAASLPRTAAGKIDRPALRRQLVDSVHEDTRQ
ncbi:MAG TPA: AMP-binding protein [Nevskiaceae bacterium]|nr:AMP-binding protein [Nevskiaceae bacterium]